MTFVPEVVGAGRGGLAKSPSFADAKSMCVFGDSYVQNADNPAFTGPNLQSALSGNPLTWLNILTNYSLRLPYQNNFGVFGDVTGANYTACNYGPVVGSFNPNVNGMISRCGPGPLSSGCDICVMIGGSNDVHTNLNYQDSVVIPARNLQQMANAMIGQGMAVIWPSIVPRATSTTTQITWLLSLNERMKRFAETTRGFYYVDILPTFCDPTAATLAPKANYMQASDQVHPSVLGGYYYALPIATLLNNAITPGFKPTWTASDAYDPVNNPNGNRLPNGMMRTGTGGSLGTGDAGATGTFVDGIIVNTQSLAPGVTAACTIVAMADGSNGQQIVLGGSNAGTPKLIIDMVVAAPNYCVAGDTVEGALTFEVNTGGSSINSISPMIAGVDSGTGLALYGATAPQSAITLPPIALGPLPIRTPRYTIQGTLTSFYLRTWVFLAPGTQSGTFRIGQLSLRKVN